MQFRFSLDVLFLIFSRTGERILNTRHQGSVFLYVTIVDYFSKKVITIAISLYYTFTCNLYHNNSFKNNIT